MKKLMETDVRYLWYLFVEMVLIVAAVWLVFISEKYIQALLIFILIELRQINYEIKTPNP